MLSKRIIPCLDIRNGRVVKGTNFEGVRDVDDPVELARYYNNAGADELVFYDITASVEQRGLFTNILTKVASEIFIPLTVGGGINEVEDFERVLRCGADKVSVNSGAIKNKYLISNAAKKYGSQCIVLSIDAKRVDGKFKVCTMGGRTITDIDLIEWAKEGETLGAGEIVLNSIDTDGVKNGFDLPMLEQLCNAVKIPVIASGGAGTEQDFKILFKKVQGVDAGLAASIFHYKQVSIPNLKNYLSENGISVRL
ncbi:MAG: imidazole glycerol phosphate synthase cyclase subunit [Epulopiscium sp. Nele67-Bin002]|nr:MAG: imidazole glycerol phosphate synthase cyclase subunit [Epulopiscium sp. Nele67-Bin002]